MSRRRPSRSQHKHLEQTAEVAEQVQRAEVVRTSKGPCPGSCNRGHRRRAEAEGEELQAPPGRPGAPVWCARCAAEISDAVHNLPRLVAWVIDIGVTTVPTRLVEGRRVPVTDPVAVLATVPGAPGEAAEVLACGHRHTIPFGPVADPSPTRVCRTCMVGVIVPEPGRLSPPPARAQGSSSSGWPSVSPLGSPAWAEADAAIEFAVAAADTARLVLGHERPARTASSSSAFRFRELVTACRYLDQWIDRLTVESGATALGLDALASAGRLRRVTGMDALVHRLDAECPIQTCQRRALERPDGGDRIRCRACRNTWDEKHYDWLVRTETYQAEQEKSGEEPTQLRPPPAPRPCNVEGCPSVGELGHHHHREHGVPSGTPCTCSRTRRASQASR